MRKSVLLIIPLILLLTTACSITLTAPELDGIRGSGNLVSEERSVSDFDQVDFSGIGEMTIIQGDKESLTIEADDNIIDHIETGVSGRTLNIGFERNFNITGMVNINYTLVVKDLSRLQLSGFGNIDIDQFKAGALDIDLSGSGNLTIAELQADRLNIDTTGFGNIEMGQLDTAALDVAMGGSGSLKLEQLTADSMKVSLTGFGNIEVGGECADVEAKITGSGSYKGGDLRSQRVTMELGGFGGATLWVEQTLDVNISGSGNVEYYGQPRVTQETSGFGKLESLGSK